MEENDGNMVRFRLVFDDRHILDKSLRSQGLRRCWFLLKPGIATVGDLASHIRESFSLHDRIVLFLDDFVLPSFESTSIITDKDIITVKKKEVKQKDICKPCDGQSLIKNSHIARVHDLPCNNDISFQNKSHKNSHGSGSSGKEKLFSCTENEVHLDPPDDVGLARRKRKTSMKLLDSKLHLSEQEVKPIENGQIKEAHQLSETEKESVRSEENNDDHESEPSNSPDVRKVDVHKKEASTQILLDSSDGEEGVSPFAVRPCYIRNQPHEKDAQEVDETQTLLFDGSSSMDGLDINKRNKFPQITDNDRHFKIDEAPLSDGLLPVPISEVISSTNNIIRPKQPVHFESLPPLRRLPVKGDVLVYRCVEQSSSVYPELSSPQVGKVSSFEYKSLQITLHPVLDYEILFKENPNGATVQRKASCIKEGSIEIDYCLLIDVRLLNTHESEGAACQKGSDMKDTWEEALAKGNENGQNISPAEQGNNGWSQWVSNKGTPVASWSCRQPGAPNAGRGNGRTNWAQNRCRNNRAANRNMTNRNVNMNNWNPNRCPANDGILSTLPLPYMPPGLPAPWDLYQNINFPPGAKYPASGKQ